MWLDSHSNPCILYTSTKEKHMFKSPEQAEAYFTSIAFYNRHIGEFVVAVAQYTNFVGSIFQ